MEINFTIDYYEGEEIGMPKLMKSWHRENFLSVKEAAEFCMIIDVPLSIVKITEWSDSVDESGIPEIIGSCNLEEAYELDYESLDF